MFVWPKAKEKCKSTEPSTKQYVDIPLELGIKQLRPKDKNKIKNKRIKWAQIVNEKELHRLKQETFKEKQKIMQEAKMKHGRDKIQKDLDRKNDRIKNQVSISNIVRPRILCTIYILV